MEEMPTKTRLYSANELKSIESNIDKNLSLTDCFVILKNIQQDIEQYKKDGFILSDFGFETLPRAFYTKYIKENYNKALVQFVDINKENQQILFNNNFAGMKVTLAKLADESFRIKSFSPMDLTDNNLFGILNYEEAFEFVLNIKKSKNILKTNNITSFEESILSKILSNNRFTCDLRYYRLLELNKVL